MTKRNGLKNTDNRSAKLKKSSEQHQPVLNEAINTAIASKIIATTPAPEIASRIKAKLMRRVEEKAHTFVFSEQGEWKQLLEGVQIKLLHQNGKQKSFLLKMEANTSIPSHAHTQDEESFVIQGSVVLEGVLCHMGDYHFAKAGSRHQAIHSAQGCTLLVKNL